MATAMPKTNPKIKIICPFKAANDQQREIWNDISPVLLLAGSVGSGKSRIIAEKLHYACKKYPNLTILIGRKCREHLKNTTIQLLREKVIGDDPQVKFDLTNQRILYTNNSRTIFFGMKDEGQAQAIRSIEADIVWFEEANKFTFDNYSEAKGRLRANAAGFNQIILTTNADSSLHWINSELIAKEKAKYYFCNTLPYPYNSQSYIETLKGIPGALGQRLREGKWIQSEGVILSGFSFEQNVIHIDSQYFKQKIAVYDDGYSVSPACLSVWGIDGDNNAHFTGMLYERLLLRPARVKAVCDRLERELIRLVLYDPAAQQKRGELEETSIITAMEEECGRRGIPVSFIAADNSVESGIDILCAAISNTTGDRPRWTFEPGCENLDKAIGEIGSYARDSKGNIIKQNDHFIDTTRYLFNYLTGQNVMNEIDFDNFRTGRNLVKELTPEI